MSPHEVDLGNCDREPIHIPGSIQPHGCVLVCDMEAVYIRRHSANAHAFFGLPEEGDLNGRRLEEVLGARPIHELRNALARSGTASRAGLMPDMELGPDGLRFDVAVHRFKGNAILEFEPTAPQAGHSPLEFTRTLVGRIGRDQSLPQLFAAATRLLRAVLQYDRVMIYEFAADGSGRVASEAKRADLESFLGQRFPASDIPKQARQLYLINPIRVLYHVDAAPVPVVPELDRSGEPLDLSHAHLRSVSPIHCEYLRNMGVSASMSVSIIVEGKLWGLIACHHYSPRLLPMNQRIAAEIFGEYFALQLEVLTQKDRIRAAASARRLLDELINQASFTTDAAAFVRANLARLGELMPCGGVGLWIEGEWSCSGQTPGPGEAASLAAFLKEVCQGRVWATSELGAVLPQAAGYSALAAGLLAVPLSQTPRDYLMFFRPEMVRTIEWGGDPNKTYRSGPLGDRLTPRRSFAIWKETVEGQSAPWTETERSLAESARAALIEVVLKHSEMLTEEREKAETRQKILNQELNHRVKNILSLIKSITAHPIRPGTGLDDYVATLKGRIEALAHAHDQVMRASGGGTLSDLLKAEFTPYRDESRRIVLDGPAVAFDTRAFSVLALVFHELATNAAKYGALSRTGGSVTVSWRSLPSGDCEIGWREQGGPRVLPPATQGFGSILIARSIPFDLGGSSEVQFRPEGFEALLRVPARHASWLADDAPRPEAGASRREALLLDAVLQGRTVMVVEDQFLIAVDVEDMVIQLGAGRVILCSHAAEAMRVLDSATPDFALLDVNLGTETSLPVAERLAELGVPFAFATGYDDRLLIDDAFPAAPALRKPYGKEAIAAVASRLLGQVAPRLGPS